jgi:alkylated DNA nucleotide flippase Atl1
MRQRICEVIRNIPKGKVSTYGAIARAAGYPGAARQVVRVLHTSFGLPWQRVVGAGGEIKLQGDSGIEQRLRLEAEGISFRGRRVNMAQHECRFAAKAKPGGGDGTKTTRTGGNEGSISRARGGTGGG